MLTSVLTRTCFLNATFVFSISRLSKEANDMKKHLNWGLDAGILEVLPYHECDLMSKDQPDYLKCLLHLQVQNITYRYSVFITGETVLLT